MREKRNEVKGINNKVVERSRTEGTEERKMRQEKE